MNSSTSYPDDSEFPMQKRIGKILHQKNLTSHELVQAYESIAHIYDEDQTDFCWEGPRVMAQTIADLFKSNREITVVMDMACGTGFVGKELWSFGFRLIDGYDPAKNMLDVARTKQVYRNIVNKGLMSDNLGVASGTYDVISLCGWHGPPEPLCEGFSEMLRFLKPGGYLVMIIREMFYKQTDYQRQFVPCWQREEQNGNIHATQEMFPNYHPNVTGLILIFKKN